MSSMWDEDDEPTENLQTSVNISLNKPAEKGYKSLGGVGIGRGRGFGNMTFLRQSLPSVGQETSGSDSSHTNGHSNNNWDDYETSSYGAKCNMQSDRNQSFKPKRGENSVSGRISSRFSSTDGSDREIPRGGGTGDRSSRVCYKCNEEGHMSRDCPKNSGPRRNKGKGCFNCGEDGHMSRDCKNPDKRVGRDGCFNCGEDGHMSRDCKNPDKRVGRNGKPREAPYIPPEPTENENELFDGVPQGINFARYEEIPVKLSGSNAPRPVNNFEDVGFRETIMKNIRRCKYDKPTPVQKYAMPIVKAKRDLMACAQTGSGKTAAFLLPMIQELIDSPDLSNPSFKTVQEPLAVVISPTRELAIQIFNEARKFSHDSIIKTELVYGGTSGGYQLQRLSKGCQILVATPGRLLDFVERGKVAFSQVRYLILDEADRMLDMGFIPAVKKMVDDPSMTVKSKRQTLMFSATFPEEIQRLAAEFLKPDYLFLAVGVVGSANMDVEQNFYQVQQYDKRQKLVEILNNSGTDRTLVFVGQKRTADFIASYMCQKGFPTTSIHGDRLQREREEALMDFRTGRMPVLVATAVAARGLDIKDVRHVINYDLPQEIDEYVHRIGRTGRVGNVGRATSFYDSSVDSALARPLLKILAEANQEIPPWLEEAAKYATGTGVPSVGGARSRYGARDFRAKGASRRNDAWETKEDVTSTYGGPPSVYSSDNFSSPLVDEEEWD
ncbi:LOW QUALITY PROTEIN: uncharacterized protein LOC143248595 [Tachypleus tridentatus]|uniref:LOW QUALITY PROTEIN: uncharacterized protein LOC143248595 n=1 Tax=Tachypleus tridentatus TaxID=6853 RepID=UPI003FCF0FC2